jgi:hypothetical protein
MIWSQMKTLAASYIHRKDLVFDDYQGPAIADMATRLDVYDNEVATALTSSVDPVTTLNIVPLPVDFGRVKALRLANVSQASASLDAVLDAATDNIFAISGATVYLSGAGPVILFYGARWPLLTDTQTNVILTKYPNVYLAALLVQAATFIQDFDALGNYNTQLDNAIGAANADKAMAMHTAQMAVIAR